jgi:hypothetical protein
MKITLKTLAEWQESKMKASGGGPIGEAQICTLGVDLRGYFKTSDGRHEMYALTLSWEEVAQLAKEKGVLLDLTAYAKEFKALASKESR